MTLATIPSRMMLYPGLCYDFGGPGNPSTGSSIVDAAGEYMAAIFMATEPMSISHVGFRCGTVSGSGTLDVRIETVDATGYPSGSLWGTNTNNAGAALTTNTWHLLALTAAAVIDVGDLFAVVWKYNSGTSVVVTRLSSFATLQFAVPYRVTNFGTPAKSNFETHYIGLGSSATQFYCIPHCYPISSTWPVFNSFNNASGTTKRGCRFQLPFRCRARGLAVGGMQSSANGDLNIFLQNDGGTDLATGGIFDGDQQSNTGFARLYAFDSPIILERDTWHRMGIEPTTATNIQLPTASLASSAYLTGWPGGVNFYSSTFTSPSWTDVQTEVPYIDLWIDQLEDSKSPRATYLKAA